MSNVIHNFHIADSIPASSGVDWETANEHCRKQNYSLVDRQDVQNNLSYFSGLPPIWSSIKGQYTPWIAYRGCIYGSFCGSTNDTNFTSTNCHTLKNNIPGNCYYECSSKNKTYGGCAFEVNFFFGLQKSLCLCICDYFLIRHISESVKCSFSCGTSFNDGECGGSGYLSLYEPMNITLPDTHFGGFCLTCRQQIESNETMLYSLACNEEANGYCVTVNGRLVSSPIMSTFDSYWKYCRNNNSYIIGSTGHICHLRDSDIWTGLQKYKITSSYIDIDNCYIVEIINEAVIYNKRNCTEKYFFLCKQESSPRQHDPSIENNTENTAQPPLTRERLWTTKPLLSSESPSIRRSTTSHIIITTNAPSYTSGGEKATIAGAIIAGILALLFIVLLVLYLLKKGRFQCFQKKQQQTNQHPVTNNTTYEDLVVTSQTQHDSHTYTTLPYDNQA